jgi:hypothetical protein
MEAGRSSEKLESYRITTLCHKPEVRYLYH